MSFFHDEEILITEDVAYNDAVFMNCTFYGPAILDLDEETRSEIVRNVFIRYGPVPDQDAPVMTIRGCEIHNCRFEEFVFPVMDRLFAAGISISVGGRRVIPEDQR